MSIRGLLFAFVLVAVTASPSHGGSNAGARAWVSWDRAGLVTELNVVEFDQREFYVQFEGLADVAGLGFGLGFVVEGDSLATLIAAEPDGQSGWASPTDSSATFLGDSSFSWIVQFPADAERSKVKYVMNSPSEGDTLTGFVYIQSAVVEDSFGAIDTIQVCAQARITGMDGPQFSVPTESMPSLAIVEFAPGVVALGHKTVFLDDIDESVRGTLGGVVGMAVAKRVFPLAPDGETLRVGVNGDTVECRDLSRIYVMKVNDFIPVSTQLATLSTVVGVENSHAVAALSVSRMPNDPSYNLQWHLQGTGPANIGAPTAWDVSTGATSLLVAVLDSGIEYHHPEIDPNQDQSRFIRGRDYGDSDGDVFDDTPHITGHGTSVGGLIGALTDNGEGVAGVMWQGKVLVHKVTDQVGICPACVYIIPSYAVAAAVDDAARRGARLVNMSFGYPITSIASFYDYITLKAFVDVANGEPLAVSTHTAHRLGSVLVASTGNSGHNWSDLPAAFPWVLGVGWSDQNGDRNSSSNYGARLDLLAPGSSLYTTDMSQSGYGYFSGTSAAAPVATGAGALLVGESFSAGLGLSGEDVSTLLKQGARDVLTDGMGWDEFTGYGHLDISRSLARIRLPYKMLRSAPQGGTVSMLQGLHKRVFLGNSGLPASEYWVTRHEVRTHVSLCAPSSEVALVWARELDSRGWSAANPNTALPYARVENVSATGFDVVTQVYWVAYDVAGSTLHQGWWPCAPEAAVAAYTASVRIPLSGMTVQGTRYDCEGTWSATTCGGEGANSYAWYERTPGGAWSDVVATTPTYSRPLFGQDLELRLELTSNGVMLADTHYVSFHHCVVDADAGEGIREVAFAVAPVPGRGGTTFRIELPVAGRVNLAVYDLSGRLVRALVDGHLEAGLHRFEWRVAGQGGSASGPGLYFAKLVTPSGSRRSRVVLVE